MAFFSNIAQKLFNANNTPDYGTTVGSHSFVADSQTASIKTDNMLNNLINGNAMKAADDMYKASSSVYLNHVQNNYLISIDNTTFGDLPDAFLQTLNKYDLPTNSSYNTTEFFLEEENGKKITKQAYTITDVVPSLFNPFFGIKSRGMATNQRLIDVSVDEHKSYYNFDTTDCSIWRLLKLSKQSDSEADMGSAVYKLADFMYCKDLGKVSNNHMITLRRYKMPVGDNIYTLSNTGEEKNTFSCLPDIGRLVTWFGTEDNKLSDIVKMSFKASWRELNAEIQQVNSKADDADKTGPLGFIANSLSPQYSDAQEAGQTGTHNIMSFLGSKIGKGNMNFGKPGQYLGDEALTNYDKNHVYEPKNTIRSNHIYEGKLTFSHEFTLTFSYKLRAYQNISQKAAMQDLIHNILMTTYRNGRFWGGSVKWLGAPNNNSSLEKMNAFIDETWDKLGGFAEMLMNGSLNWQELMGSVSDAAGKIIDAGKEEAKKIMGQPSETAREYANSMAEFAKSRHWGEAMKGALKNTLGRPALYAIHSLISGDNLGLWHVTIGNPLNPIMVIGNLIIENTELEFGDCPLGLEDFPTEIKCRVTLKHCRPRDAADISRMFTKGEGAIALPLGQGGITNYYKNGAGYGVFSHDSKSVNGEYVTENSINVASDPKTTNTNKYNYVENSFQETFGTSHVKSIIYNAASFT